MTEISPSSIELSSIQRQVLEVIVLKETSIQGQAWREQIILLWEQGVSASETAQELKVDVSVVNRMRQKWLSSTEEKLHNAMVDMISEVVQILNSGKDRPKSISIPSATAAWKKRKGQTDPPQELIPGASLHNRGRIFE